MNWTSRIQRTQNRLTNRRFLAAAFEVDNRFDNHGQPGRDDYSVLLVGTGAVPTFVGGRLAEVLRARCLRGGSTVSTGWVSRASGHGSSPDVVATVRRSGSGGTSAFGFKRRATAEAAGQAAGWTIRKTGAGTT